MSRLKTTMTTAAVYDNLPDADRGPSCLAGLYLLTPQGSLGLLDGEGMPVMDPSLTAGLTSGIDSMLELYRDGAVCGLGLGLVADPGPGEEGTIVFSDDVLNTLFDAGRREGMPLTRYEKRNKRKALSRGLELLLNKKRSGEPLLPYFCPVLIPPEVSAAALGERYGVELDGAGDLYEVLDLSAAFRFSPRPPQALFEMRTAMRRAQALGVTAPEGAREGLSNGSLATVGDPSSDFPVASVTTGTFFKDGDPVTGWLLAWFSPFNELTETQREIIAGYETIHRAPAGSRLIQRYSTEDLCLYLVEGTLELTTEEGENIRVSGGTRRSRLPISVLTPHVYDVTAVSEVSIVVFSQKLVRKINEITRTYTGIDRPGTPDASTAAISNGVQSVYFRNADVSRSLDDS